jgi:hypothetical protein
MEEQDAVQSASVELQLPGKEAGRYGWNRRHRGNEEVVISGGNQCRFSAQLSGEVESNANDEQRDREMD